jgi:hypothetical protein
MAASSPLDQHAAPVADHGTTSGKATASMIVGIVAILLAIFFGILSLPVSIVGLVLAILARGDINRGATNRGMATAGLVLNIIAMVIALAWLALGVAMFASNN